MKDDEKKKYIIILFISLIIVASLPFLIEQLIIRNEPYSSLSNGEWGGFLGSYLGGIISGIGTIAAVWVTTKETRAIQTKTQENIESDRKIRRREYRKSFTDEVAQIISEYITDISGYYYASRNKEAYKRELAVKNYYLLQIKLKEIENSLELIEHLELIHNNYSFGDVEPKVFNDAIESMMKKFSQFSKNYIEQEK